MAAPAQEQLTEADQNARRDWFRRHWTHIPFNRLCGLQVRHWGTDRVEIVVPYSDDLSAHPGVLHGGVLSALIDTAATGAVLAGHDFTRGSRISTVTMSVQYLAVARNEDVLATAVAVKRGRLVHVASVEVTGLSSSRLLATGQVTATVEGHRPGLLGPLPGDPPPGETATA
jgi:uncharacterized protein (TIGR00369 family)